MLLEKYKEKNSAVGKAVSDALTLMHKYCWGLLDVSDSLAGGARGVGVSRGLVLTYCLRLLDVTDCFAGEWTVWLSGRLTSGGNRGQGAARSEVPSTGS